MKAIVMQCQFTRFSSRVDGSVGFSGTTPELTAVEKCALFDLQNKNTRVLIEPQDYAVESKIEVKGILDSKPPSQRLRGALFVLWKQLTDKGQLKDTPFDGWYAAKMNIYIEDVKSQLDPE